MTCNIPSVIRSPCLRVPRERHEKITDAGSFCCRFVPFGCVRWRQQRQRWDERLGNGRKSTADRHDLGISSDHQRWPVGDADVVEHECNVVHGLVQPERKRLVRVGNDFRLAIRYTRGYRDSHLHANVHGSRRKWLRCRVSHGQVHSSQDNLGPVADWDRWVALLPSLHDRIAILQADRVWFPTHCLWRHTTLCLELDCGGGLVFAPGSDPFFGGDGVRQTRTGGDLRRSCRCE